MAGHLNVGKRVTGGSVTSVNVRFKTRGKGTCDLDVSNATLIGCDRPSLSPIGCWPSCTGHINHSPFWINLARASSKGQGIDGTPKDGLLKEAIFVTFGSLDNLWLGLNPSMKCLEVTAANQDPLLTHVSIIAVDIWEHAFNLRYLNLKVDNLNFIWSVTNFEEAEKCLTEAGGASKL